ncbi:uncharacterized protein LOC131426015 [Malaya genurostris]|uniref:uncharacterized protein LOC131426015 n=1 Tax=Malaya genurostris TaxID=325434 RepID=UPI0026F3E6AF|nr:uncharacterized protein LOC131426015 [Malaya genurostris]
MDDSDSFTTYEDPLYSSKSEAETTKDSNAENNFRNDYPDEEEDFSGYADSASAESMRSADLSFVENEGELPGGSDSSGFAYPIQEEVEVNVLPAKVTPFESAYAKYMAARAMQNSTDECDLELESSESENLYLYD